MSFSFRPSYANVVATLALMIAVVGFAGGPQAVAAAVKKLAPNAVGTKNIKNNAVVSAKVRNGSLGGADIKNGSLGGVDIADRSIGSQDIGRFQIFDPNLATGSVNSRVIRDDSITSADISDNSITNNDIAPGAITSANIGPRTVQGANLAPETIGYGNLDPAAVESLTNQWNPGAIAKGSTLTGYTAIAYVPTLDPADSGGAQHPEVRALSVSFPQRVTDLKTVRFAGAPECTGTWDNPTASIVQDAGQARGVVCVYPRTGSLNNLDLDGVDLLDQSDFGFALLIRPTEAQKWTTGQFTWAFTRPAA